MSGRTDYKGIDYGLGLSNIDTETGIRYGVISRHSLADWFEDEIQPVYTARCPECGCEDINEIDMNEEQQTDANMRGACGHEFDEEEQYGDEADYWELPEQDGIKVEISETEIFVTKSPVCITAQFCSPCMPGAGNLDCPCDSGPLTYALPLDWLRESDEYRMRAYEAWDLISTETRQACGNKTV